MRRLLIAFPVVLLCAASAWANSILDVSIWGKFTPTSTSCISNCTESINVRFQFDTASIVTTPGDPNGWIDPSTFQISSSGYLGSFSQVITPGQGIEVHWNDQYIPLFDSSRDELDIRTPVGPDPRHPIFFPVGTNTIQWYFYTCGSGCQGGSSSRPQFTEYGSEVTPAPDGDSWLVASVAAIVLGFATWNRYRATKVEATSS
jgi:hypothetical protein